MQEVPNHVSPPITGDSPIGVGNNCDQRNRHQQRQRDEEDVPSHLTGCEILKPAFSAQYITGSSMVHEHSNQRMKFKENNEKTMLLFYRTLGISSETLITGYGHGNFDQYPRGEDHHVMVLSSRDYRSPTSKRASTFHDIKRYYYSSH